mmetsp:Transcript_25474/g.37408  ORF Transcript_25474/g.37408 Transcript_25474/m.37408 type:complete len:99 (-) Transcript_25474:503-799(-)
MSKFLLALAGLALALCLHLPTCSATTAFVFRSMVPAPSDKMSSKTTKMHSCDSLEAPKDLRGGEQNNQVERAPVTPRLRQGVVEELKEAFFSGINVVM